MLDTSTVPSARQNVDIIALGEKQIYLIGTAHISQSSADLVEQVVREVKPESIAIELCSSRFQSIKDPNRWKSMDIVSVLKQGRGYVLLAQLLLAGFQKKLGNRLKVAPGAEMIRAISIAEETSTPLVLADREVRTTLKRTWASLGLVQMFKLSYSMFGGVFGDYNIDEAEIERLKTSDVMTELMNDFAKAFPRIRESLISERDRYLAKKISDSPGKKVVAVVGAGHVPGIKEWIGKDIDLAALERIPPPTVTKKIISWVIPGALIALLGYGFIKAGAAMSLDMLLSWIWINGAFAATGALLALGHPLSILAAFVAAPLTTLHPLLASGWVAGIVEAMVRKPTVADLESIADDIVTVKGLWRNRVSRILLVMALTNLFGTIGALIGIGEIASKL